jgi:hypothetical protein
MSQRSPGAGRRLDVPWSVLVVVASAVGGLAAAAVSHVSVAVALIVAILTAAGLLIGSHRLGPLFDSGTDRPARPARPPPAARTFRDPGTGTQAGPAAGPSAAGPAPGPAGPVTDPADRPGPSSAVRLMQPSPVSGDAPWWEKSAALPVVAAEPGAAPPLSSYLDSALIAQCPRCGWFGIDAQQGLAQQGSAHQGSAHPESAQQESAHQESAPWRFECQACQNRWTWRPGTAWPPVEVRPRLRHQHRAPPGPGSSASAG